MSQQDLGQVLSSIPEIVSVPELLIGSANSDDAAVYSLGDGRCLVQTVDFFTPIVEDPFLFGQIAAVNALSDIYAMGAKPILALNLVAFPTDSLPIQTLEKILAGGANILKIANCPLGGGHSVKDGEPKYGLCVTGLVSEKKIISNQGGQPGDLLVLTKSLGTGAISRAIRKGLFSIEDFPECKKSLITLNRGGSEVMSKNELFTGTDITGFGLLGHLRNILLGSNLSAELFYENLPVFDGVKDLVKRRVFPGVTIENLNFIRPQLDVETGILEEHLHLFVDPQTAGGLLMAVPQEKLDRVLSDLKASPEVICQAIIGRLVEKDGKISKITLKLNPPADFP
ncbi:selenide, water dikinase SelD [Candidatus Riflebacteria bacterium]